MSLRSPQESPSRQPHDQSYQGFLHEPSDLLRSLKGVNWFALLTFTEVVASTAAMLRNVEVLWVVEGRVHPVLNAVDNSGFQVDQKCSWNIVLVVSLVEEDIFSVVTLCCVLLKNAISRDAVLHAELLPKLVADCIKMK